MKTAARIIGRSVALPITLLLVTSSTSWGAIQFSDWVSQPNFNNGDQTVQLLRGGTASMGQHNTWGNGNGGGEFLIRVRGPGGNWTPLEYTPLVVPSHVNETSWWVKTFCTERGETFSPGTEYTVTIDDDAWYGKNHRDGEAPTHPEPLTAESKLLYGLYFEGRLEEATGFWSYNNHGASNEFQEAIWTLEDTSGASGVAADLRDWATANLDNYQLFGEVKVLNLWKIGQEYQGFANAHQSQLIYVPVPEPASVAVWLTMGGIGVAVGWRRRSKRQ